MKARIQLFILLSILLTLPIFGQSPYQFNWKGDAALLGGGVLTSGLGISLYSGIQPLTPEEIRSLNSGLLKRFDRQATLNYSEAAADLSDVLFISTHALPALFLIDDRSRSDFGKIMLMYGETFFLNAGINLIAKTTVQRTRPYVYNPDFSEEIKVKPNARMSFYSGHTSMTAANTFFFAKVFADYFPDSRLKPFVWAAAVAIPAITGYCRVQAGKHYLSDVMVGYGMGAAIGFLVPQLHRRSDKDANLTFFPGAGGGSLVWKISR